MPGPNLHQNHGLDSSKANQREMGENSEGAEPSCSHGLASQQLERAQCGLGPSPPYGPFLSKRKKMEGEGLIGLGPSISLKGGEGYSCGGPLEINKKTHEGSNEPLSSGTSSPSSKMGVSCPRAFGRLEEAKGVSREETNMEDVNSRENQCQRASLSSEAGVWDRSWENTGKGCVEESMDSQF